MIRSAIIVLVCVGLAGCGSIPIPETPRERYAAAEFSYRAAITTIGNLADAGTIKKGTQVGKRTAMGVRAARGALDVWGEAPDSQPAEIVALTALRALQSILSEIGRGSSI